MKKDFVNENSPEEGNKFFDMEFTGNFCKLGISFQSGRDKVVARELCLECSFRKDFWSGKQGN